MISLLLMQPILDGVRIFQCLVVLSQKSGDLSLMVILSTNVSVLIDFCVILKTNNILGAVVAREYGLPCVISAVNATKVFKSGK